MSQAAKACHRRQLSAEGGSAAAGVKQIGKPPERGRLPPKAALNIVTGGIGRNRPTVIDFPRAALLKMMASDTGGFHVWQDRF